MHAYLMTALLLAADAIPPEVQQVGLSQEDWNKLSAGEILVRSRPVSVKDTQRSVRGAMLIKTPWRHAFDQIGQHEEMLEYSSCMKAMEVVLQTQAEARTTIKVRETHQSLWMRATYTLDYVHDPESRQIRWSLDPAAQNDVVRMSGSWLFIPLGDEKTVAIYSLTGSSGGALPPAVDDYFKRMMVPGVLQTIRTRVETAHSAGKHGD